VELLLPLFNSLIQKSITIDYVRDASFLLGCIAIALVVGIASGSYPAFFLSAFDPARVLKGTLNSRLGVIGIRKTLVVAQFAVAIALILSTVVIQNQLGYVRNKKLGFEKDNIVVIPISEVSLQKQHEIFKNELLQNPSILNVSAASGTPFDGGSIAAFHGSRLHIKIVDYDYIPTLQIELTQGRNFVATDTAAFILSETVINMMEWDDSLGKTFATGVSNMRYNSGTVIGVIKDFNANSLHRAIEPIALQFSPDMFTVFLVKIRTENIPATLDFLKQKWLAFVPNHPFEYSFLDDEFDKLYRSEQQLGKIFGYFSFLAILISCLGLFGLTAFAVERRTKEIGIRKALGASVANILFLLSKDFMKLVILANLMAWPVAYVAMQSWLQKFAYRIEIGSWMFLAAGGLVLIIALIAVSFQTIKAAVTNPVESLRYE
ncbi:MAG: ABC transporter permease, partial [bacterium]